MKLPTNTFTQGLATSAKQVGLWVSLGSNFSAETIAPSGYDWVLLDMEHAPTELGAILSQLQVFKASSTISIVRPSWNDSVLVKRLLDIGAPGLLFPMIQSVEEAKLAVSSTRYPPNGIRGVSGSTRANAFGRITDYFDRIEQETAVLLQLETLPAIEQAVEIGTVDGVSGIFFGPADIAADMGLLGQPMNSAVWDVIRPAARKLMDAGVPVGTLVFDTTFAAELLNDGFSFVACGSDAALLAKGADALLSTVRGAVK